MKKYIIIILLMIFYINGKSQCNLPYRPLTEFGTDTTAFMKYNFKDRAECYKGKTLKEVNKDLQIPIKDFMNTWVFGYTERITGMYIYVHSSDYVRYLMINHKNYNSVYIEFEEIIEENNYTKKSQKGWDTELYNYFKDKKIKRLTYVEPLRKRTRSNP